ncbi:uncharacterized protein LOC113204551 [Frankliniella occidentalis]|uniref:Uncharacterized protein LOC113204551 n=1 Tax=Frankliniella occidentalis TaxID=133901 RepID=A0A6J1S2U1_FRAOC|nr:uncharacterized protein LOC113204551 [Frankliniella occidentalis]
MRRCFAVSHFPICRVSGCPTAQRSGFTGCNKNYFELFLLPSETSTELLMALARPPGSRLLLVATQTASWTVAQHVGACQKVLTPMTVEHVAIRPLVGYYGKIGCISLLIQNFASAGAGACNVHCVMEATNGDQTSRAEGRVCLNYAPGQDGNIVEVMSLPCLGQTFNELQVSFAIFDASTCSPPTGVGVGLNKCRLAGTLCDVKLVVDGGVELAAHRAVLAGRSQVLNRMLTGDFKEAREARVELLDFSRAAVEKFLEYLYLDHVEDWDWGGSELELLQLADKYMVRELYSDCSLRLWCCDSRRALEVLHAAGLTDILSSKLRQRLTGIVVADIKALVGTEQWTAFRKRYATIADTILGSTARLRKTVQ